MYRRLRYSAILAASFLLLGNTADARTLIWAPSRDALTLDPHAVNEAHTLGFVQQMYEPLVKRGYNGELEPALAVSWNMTGDSRIWEFHLRPDVVFHDRSPFTADDVVFSLRRAMAETSDMRGLLTTVESVARIDDRTVQVTTKSPDPLLPQNLTYVFMMSKAWSEANGAEVPPSFQDNRIGYATEHANGTGPYVLVSRSAGLQTKLRRFEEYWGKGDFPSEAVGVTELIYQVIGDPATRVQALNNGEVDFVQDLPVQDVDKLANTEGLHVATGAENRTIFLGFNVADGENEAGYTNAPGGNPFADAQVREAINLAIDREAISQITMDGRSVPAGEIVPPGVNGYNPDFDAVPTVDVEQARALMNDAGLADGFSTTLHCPNDRYINDEKICQSVAQQLARIGIDVTVSARSRQEHFPEVQRGELDFYLLGWGVATYDSSNIFSFLYHTTTTERGGWNGTNYSNPQIDAAIYDIDKEIDENRRNEKIAEVWAILHPEHIYVAIHHQVLAWGMTDALEASVRVHPDNALWVKDFRFVD